MKGLLFAAFACLLAVPAAASDTRVGSWLSTMDKDPITGAARARAQANNPARPPAFFQVRCYDRRPLALVGTPRAPYGDGDRRWVVLKIDQAAPVVVPMVGIKGTRVLAAPLGRDNYARLADVKRLAVRVLETDGTHIDMAYQLTRTPQALKPVRALCPDDTALDRPAAAYDPAQALPPVPPAARTDGAD